MPFSSTNALMPGVSRLYFAQVVPVLDAIWVIQSLSWLSSGDGVSFLRKLYSTEPACSCSWGVRRLEIEIEIGAGRRCPREAPAHALLEGLQFRERRPRHRPKHDVVIREVNGNAVEAVCDRRAGRTAGRILRPEHEVVDEELRAASEKIGEGRLALVGLETVLLVDLNPGQILPLLRQLVASAVSIPSRP